MRRKGRYIAHLVLPNDIVTTELYADLTEKQAGAIAAWLTREKNRGAIKDFYLGPPQRMELVTAMFFNAEGLRAQLQSTIEDFERLRE
jgi:hypothetical protein